MHVYKDGLRTSVVMSCMKADSFAELRVTAMECECAMSEAALPFERTWLPLDVTTDSVAFPGTSNRR